MDSKKELDIVKFNKEFDYNSKKQFEHHQLNYKTIIKPKKNKDINSIDKNILKMRLSFDHIIQKIEFLENPITEITESKDLMEGTILLCFFIGLLTMILAGLMKQ